MVDWDTRYIKQVEGGYHCNLCDLSLASESLAAKHDFDCPSRANIRRKFAQWVTSRFIRNHGFDKQKSSTKILEFTYFRYVMDRIRMVFLAVVFLVRIVLLIEIEGIPYSGTMPFSNRDLFGLFIALVILLESIRNVKEYKIKVINEIPKLQKELGVTQENLKKSS